MTCCERRERLSTRQRTLSCLLAGALALPLGAAAQVRLGNEFQVSLYTVDVQRNASVATEANGDFIIAWEGANNQDGQGFGIFARRYSSAGTALASEFQVNTFTTLNQYLPSVDADTDGDFVVAWRSPQDGSNYGVFARRFSSNGVALASEFQVNTRTEFQQRFPRVALDADGDFVIAWQTFPHLDGSGYGISAQRFSSAGAFLGAEFQVNTYTPGYQRYPSVSADADGDFVVAWQSADQDGSGFGIFARRFSSSGAFLAAEFQVNAYTTNEQSYPSVASTDDGAFVVAWDSPQDGDGFGVFARRFSSAGTPLANELQVNTFFTETQRSASVATDAAGDFVIAWQSGSFHDGFDNGIFARLFSSAGSPLATEFQVNDYTLFNQRSPSLAMAADGDFVVAWWSNTQDGATYGVFARRFGKSRALDIDGNGVTEPLTDGLLVLRSFFGFNGPALTNGVVGPNCTRCDAAAIEPYVDALGLVLDIDGNGTADALTDGLLVLRFLFGFTDPALTSGVVAQNCTRCDGAVVVPYIAPLAQ